MSSILDKYVVKSEKISYRTISDEVVIMTPTNSTLHSLNAIGAKIFNYIDGKKTVDDLCALVLAEYDSSLEEVVRDMEAFLNELIEKKIITLTDTPS